MVVEVTQEDIDLGQRRSWLLCPIARAVGRAVPGRPLYAVGDGLHDALTYGLKYTFSETTRRCMQRYDETGKMRPFRFRLYPYKVEVNHASN
jgi:hypothetical protein